MNYLIMLGGVLLSSVTAVFLKIYQKRFGNGTRTTLLFTACMTASIALVMIIFARFRLHLRWQSMLVAVAMGLLYVGNMPTYQKALSVGSIGMCSVFLFLGALLLPFLYGVVFLSESLTVMRTVGLVVVLAAVLTQLGFKSAGTKSFFLYGIAIFIMNGLFCVFLKVESQFRADTFEVMFVAGATAAIVSLIAFLSGHKKDNKPLLSKKDVAVGASTTVGYGVMNGFANVINLYIAGKLPAVVQFPINSAGTIIITILFGIIFFREKISVRNIFAVLLSIAAIVLFTV